MFNATNTNEIILDASNRIGDVFSDNFLIVFGVIFALIGLMYVWLMFKRLL